MAAQALPAHLHEDPPFYAEGLRWVRMDLTPPVERIYQDGTIYERPYVLTAGEGEPASPGGGATAPGTTVTFAVAASLDDQHVYKSGVSYPPASGPVRNSTVGQVFTQRSYYGASTGYFTHNGLLRFDTSSLPDGATVTAATLRLYAVEVSNVDGRNFRGEYYAWDGSSATDYTDDGSAGTTAFEVPISGVRVSDNDFVLGNLSLISKTGFTSFRLHVTGGQPSGANFVRAASFDGSSYPEPRLIVTHST